MKKLGRNTIAVGAATLLITSAASFSANAAEEFTAHAEAQFISAGDQALGSLLGTIADQIEGVEVTCEPGTAPADCTVTQASDAIVSLPISDLAGLQLGAANNFASGDSSEGSSVAASGAVSDSGTINTDGGGTVPADLQLNLNEGALGPITAIADPVLSLGAISAVAELDSPTSAVERDYNIAGANLSLTIPALATVNDAIEGQIGTTLGNANNIGLTAVCDALGEGLRDVPGLGDLLDLLPIPLPIDTIGLDALCEAIPDDALELNFPSLNALFAGVQDNTDDGVDINLDNGSVTINLQQILQAEGLDINNLPPSTDLVPFITGALDEAVTGILNIVTALPNSIVTQLVNGSSIELLGTELEATALNALLDPLTEGLETALTTISTELAAALPDLTGPDALGQVLQILVNVPDLADTTLVGEEDGSPSFSQTAVQVRLLQGQAADLRLATAVVGPNAAVDVADDADADAQADVDADVDADGADADSNDADAIADADSDAQADSLADGDAQADADVTTALPAAGAPNLLPFWLLGLGLVLFGAAVLINERRRSSLI